MTSYALLLLPSANRVYAEAAIELTLAELRIFSDAVLGGRLHAPAPSTIADVPYVTFDGDLTEDDLAYLANVSTRYALFERVSPQLLAPVRLSGLDQFDDDLLTIQKYAGKTNEQFTKLLLNVTVLASGADLRSRVRLLDPLCGRGTTLNQGLMYGYDASGLDLDAKDVEAYAGFIQTYLQRKKIKHQHTYGPLRRDKKVVGRRLWASIGAAGQTLEVINADTVRALDFFRPESFDVLVADLPYGVQHGSHTVAAGLRRSPLALLAEAGPVWARLLRPGGALGISWNTHVAARSAAASVLTDAGLSVVESTPYLALRHRVDQSINRDILVATKPLPT